jgi:hypothetical protein
LNAVLRGKQPPLFVKQRLPICRHRSGRSGRRLIQRMTVRGVKLRAVDEFLRAIVVKPPLTRLETRDDRMARGGVMFRCVLIWRRVAAADVTAFGASAKMKPPCAHSQTFDATGSAWLDRRVDTVPLGLHRPCSDFRLAFSPHNTMQPRRRRGGGERLLAFPPGAADISRGRLAVDEPLANRVRSGRKQP